MFPAKAQGGLFPARLGLCWEYTLRKKHTTKKLLSLTLALCLTLPALSAEDAQSCISIQTSTEEAPLNKSGAMFQGSREGLIHTTAFKTNLPCTWGEVVTFPLPRYGWVNPAESRRIGRVF